MKRLSIIFLVLLLWLPAITLCEQYGENLSDGTYSIQALWHLNDNSSTESDSSGNGNDGTVNGATYTANGKFGGAYNFDGSNDYIAINTLTGFDGDTGSLALWVYDTEASKSTSVYLMNIYYNSSYRLRIYIGTSSDLAFYWRAVTGWTVSSSTWTTDVWHFVGATWDTSAGELALYLDGEQVDFDDTVTKTWSGVPTTNAIGSRYDGGFNFFQGILDEICLWDRVLTEKEIKHLYGKMKGTYGIH